MTAFFALEILGIGVYVVGFCATFNAVRRWEVAEDDQSYLWVAYIVAIFWFVFWLVIIPHAFWSLYCQRRDERRALADLERYLRTRDSSLH